MQTHASAPCAHTSPDNVIVGDPSPVSGSAGEPKPGSTSAPLPTPLRLLERGLALISEPGGWNRREYFPGSFSNPGSPLDRDALLSASCFCAAGAIYRAMAECVDSSVTNLEHCEPAEDVVDVAYRCLSEAVGLRNKIRPANRRCYSNLVEMNDDPETTLAEMQAVFQVAIEAARAAQAGVTA